MTLIINEIYMLDDLNNTFIVASADRKITYRRQNSITKKLPKTAQKLFKLDSLNSTLSYWGSCSLKNDNGREELFSSWLPNYINNTKNKTNLRVFAEDLRVELNKRIYQEILKIEPSGFHFSGYNKDGVPEFYHFSNCIYNPNKMSYENCQEQYHDLIDDFLGHNAKDFGWDGINKSSIKADKKVQTYRNGDIRVHVAAWDKLDEVFMELFKYDSFQKPNSIYDKDIIKLTKFKFNFIGNIYQNWAREKKDKIIGGPYNIEILRPIGSA